MLPSSCLDGSVTPVVPGQNPQYTGAVQRREAVGCSQGLQDEPTKTTDRDSKSIGSDAHGCIEGVCRFLRRGGCSSKAQQTKWPLPSTATHQSVIRGKSDHEMGCRLRIGVKVACEFQLCRAAAVLMRNQCWDMCFWRLGWRVIPLERRCGHFLFVSSESFS